jgi:D-lactate dehydrogenase
MIFSTKGFTEVANGQRSALEASLLKASQGGKLPIVVDTSPCLAQLKAGLTDSQLRCAPPSAHLTQTAAFW